MAVVIETAETQVLMISIRMMMIVNDVLMMFLKKKLIQVYLILLSEMNLVM